jgi:hypothetical protein
MAIQFNRGSSIPSNLQYGEPFALNSGELYFGDVDENPVKIGGSDSSMYITETHQNIITELSNLSGIKNQYDFKVFRLNFSYNKKYPIYLYGQNTAAPSRIVEDLTNLMCPLEFIPGLSPETHEFSHNAHIFLNPNIVDISDFTHIIVKYVPDYNKTANYQAFSNGWDINDVITQLQSDVNQVIQNLSYVNSQASEKYFPEAIVNSFSDNYFEKTNWVIQDMSTNKVYKIPAYCMTNMSASYYKISFRLFSRKIGTYRVRLEGILGDITVISTNYATLEIQP